MNLEHLERITIQIRDRQKRDSNKQRYTEISTNDDLHVSRGLDRKGLAFGLQYTVPMNPIDVIFGFSIDARLGDPMVAFVSVAWPHLVGARHVVPAVVMVSFSTPFGFEEAEDGE